ncbi:ABC transporter, permease protein [Sulfitobacter noctilucae]|uniref:ABC transporter transmembrane domain-containing protein n=1 Tax=Sulfitobacter noctilucae TaxID=1342302 RepID=UPI000469024F|nr:ABC transporter transmembrane domain-containing protein [Sulfitobacter noctilucae]KIN75340.1 ABC transporter, permease protein [Sulfitobacter noctilucae]
MESTIFSFIWKYSRRDQLYLLAFTLFTFPFLYATLELPKRIINDAIGAESNVIDFMGVELTQVQFLMALCFSYLGAVLVHGLLKMRLNTMKGVLSERMLRRFRYQLLKRMMRFPRSYFQETSQGELVSMVTSEAEPMGGLMGDFIAQPVFQAGQMLVILMFLFLQSFWFGLAGIALIPLQAWLIPLLQRQINELNKQRIKEVRQFSAEIGETAAGITDLRTNGGWRYRLAGFTERLGKLFEIRFKIFQKKFFMKFLNNFITQLTPFFFYAVGGYLAIKGDITVGALVAALAAYKDLSSPWKELLTYYNQTQDMAVRWDVVIERFAPNNMIDEALFDGTPEDMPHLRGDIELSNISVRGSSGDMTLRDISFTIPAGSQVAIEISNQTERTALAEVLTREITPTRGKVIIAGHDLSDLHQAVIAARIGYAQAQPYLFFGDVGDNLLMPLRTNPTTVPWGSRKINRAMIEAWRSGNSPDSTDADWLDPEIAGLESREDVNRFFYEITDALGTADTIFERMLESRMDPAQHPDLASRIVGLRDKVHQKLKHEGLEDAVLRFDPDQFNPAVPLGGNLTFAAPLRDISQAGLVEQRAFLAMVMDQGLGEQAIAISQTLVETLHETFGMDGTDHPLFTALGIEEPLYEQLVDIANRRKAQGDEALTSEEFALLLTVPFALTAEQIGPSFPESFKQEIVRIRKSRGMQLREQAKDLFVPIEPDRYLPRLTLLENLIYGRFSGLAGLQADLVRDVIKDLLTEADLKQMISATLFDVPTAIGGTNLPAVFQQRAAFGRAAIKRPDVLVLNQSLIGRDAETQAATRNKLSTLLPDTTQIYINDSFANPQDFDLHIEIKHGQIDGVEKSDQFDHEDSASDDLRRKLRIISRDSLFSSLNGRNRRLLAFAAQWYTAYDGQTVFAVGDRSDAVYLCLSGRAELGTFGDDGVFHHISDVEPGRLIGDLAVILNEPRQLVLIAREEVQFLRIGAEQFRSVVESDKVLLLSLLRTVAGYLTAAADLMIAAGIEPPRELGPPPPAVQSESAAE